MQNGDWEAEIPVSPAIHLWGYDEVLISLFYYKKGDNTEEGPRRKS